MKNVWLTRSSRSSDPAPDGEAVCCHFGQASRVLKGTAEWCATTRRVRKTRRLSM
jgi:hypothetical protein